MRVLSDEPGLARAGRGAKRDDVDAPRNRRRRARVSAPERDRRGGEIVAVGEHQSARLSTKRARARRNGSRARIEQQVRAPRRDRERPPAASAAEQPVVRHVVRVHQVGRGTSELARAAPAPRADSAATPGSGAHGSACARSSAGPRSSDHSSTSCPRARNHSTQRRVWTTDGVRERRDSHSASRGAGRAARVAAARPPSRPTARRAARASQRTGYDTAARAHRALEALERRQAAARAEIEAAASARTRPLAGPRHQPRIRVAGARARDATAPPQERLVRPVEREACRTARPRDRARPARAPASRGQQPARRARAAVPDSAPIRAPDACAARRRARARRHPHRSERRAPPIARCPAGSCGPCALRVS